MIKIPFRSQKIIKFRNLIRCSPQLEVATAAISWGIVHAFTISLCAHLPEEAVEAQKVREFVKVTWQVGKRGRLLSGTQTPSLSACQRCIVPWKSAAPVDVTLQILIELFTVSQSILWVRPDLRMS